MRRIYQNGAVVLEAGEGLVVHETVQVFGKGVIRVGRNVRIDAFCVLSVGPDGLSIGDNVHVGAGVFVFGSTARVVIGNGCSLSPRATIYTASDDFRKLGLIGSQHPRALRNLNVGPVMMEDESALGHGAVLFPGALLRRGATVGAYCLVTEEVLAGHFYCPSLTTNVKVRT